jgi:hypothetical protein
VLVNEHRYFDLRRNQIIALVFVVKPLRPITFSLPMVFLRTGLARRVSGTFALTNARPEGRESPWVSVCAVPDDVEAQVASLPCFRSTSSQRWGLRDGAPNSSPGTRSQPRLIHYGGQMCVTILLAVHHRHIAREPICYRAVLLSKTVPSLAQQCHMPK